MGRTNESEKLQKEALFFDRLALEQESAWWGHKTYAGKERLKRRAQLAAQFLSPISEQTEY